MPGLIIPGICAQLRRLPGQETADIIANWTNSRYTDNNEFYFGTGINCGDPNQDGRDPVNSTDTYHVSNSGNSIVHIGVTDQLRYSGTHSVMMYTDASIYATCNQNNSVERAELSVNDDWRATGRAAEGQTVWMGWSEKWTDIDESHTATILQFRSNCGAGSPATQINMKPNRELELRTREDPVYKSLGTIQEDVWYDWIVEIKYSKGYDGYIKVWIYEAGDSDNYSYNDTPTGQILNNPTMLSTDGCPHLRWGVYRWESGDLMPSAINVDDQMMVRYVGPARWKYGNNLGTAGFDAVKPRPISSGNPPAVPTLSSPANNATDQPLSLNLVWNSVSEATSYDYQVSTTSNFSSIVKSGSTASTQVNVSGLSYSTTYYWRVLASNSYGSSAWSGSRSFTTLADAWAGSLESSLNWQIYSMTSRTGSFSAEFDMRANTANMNGVFALADNATNPDTYDDLACIVRTSTDGYIDVRNGSAYTKDVTVNYGAGDVFHVRMEINVSTKKYDVYVTPDGGSEVQIANNYDFRTDQAGINVLDCYVLKCEILSLNIKDLSFTTLVDPPAVPTLSSPANNATDQPLSLNLVWNAVSEATSYSYQVSTVSNFSSVVESGSTASTQVNISGLSHETTYYWRVLASNTGGSSAWSASRSFTTVVAPPAAPTLSSPADNATDQPLSLDLVWNAVSGATSYSYQVSTTLNFSSIVESGSTASTQIGISGLSYSTTYYWRVQASNAGGSSAWSGSRSFTTQADSWTGSLESSLSWQIFSMTAQTDSFTAEFDLKANTANMDGVFALADNATNPDTYDDLACIVRFNTNGYIDVRNGSAYAKDVTVNYGAGDAFHVRMEINVSTKKYDVFVTPEGGSEVQVASAYNFRTDQSSINVLDCYVVKCEILSYNVKDITFTTATDPWENSHESSLDWQAFTMTSQTGSFTAEFDMRANTANMNGVTGLADAATGIDDYDDLACNVRFGTAGYIDVRTGTTYAKDATVNYGADDAFHVRMVVNISTKKYDVFVTPEGGSEVQIADDYDFRSTQSSVSTLNRYVLTAVILSHNVKDFSVSLSKSIADEDKTQDSEKLPTDFALMQNHPNPFNPVTTITFTVPEMTHATLTVYNQRGRLIRTLHSGLTSAGVHRVIWDGMDDYGSRVSSGVYLYRLSAKDFVSTRKLVFIK